MRAKKIKKDNIQVKTTVYDQGEKREFSCSKTACEQSPIGELVFTVTKWAFRFCAEHEQEMMAGTKTDTMEKCKTWLVNYFPQREIPKDIKEMADQVGFSNFVCYNNSPMKLEGMRILLKDMLANPDKYGKKTNGK